MTFRPVVSKTSIVWIVLLGLLVTGCSLASEPVPMGPIQRGPLPTEIPPVPLQVPNATNGALIFADRCAQCHGVTGDGVGELAAELAEQGAQAAALADPALASQRTPAQWFSTITNGTIQSGGLMPPWRDTLSETERWDVTYFLYSLSVDPDQLAQADGQYTDLAATCAEDTALANPPGLIDTASLSPQMLMDTYLDSGEDCVASAALPQDEAYALAVYLLTRPTDAGPHAGLALDVPAEDAEGDAAAEGPSDSGDAVVEEVPALDLSNGRIEGSVMLFAQDGATPVSIEVRLEGLALGETENFDQIADVTTTTDESGNYVFEGLPFDIPRSAYIVTVQYEGVEYGNGIIIDGISSSAELPITVFENTSDPSVVNLSSLHIYAQSREDGLLVSEIRIYGNTSDRVYLSSTGETPTSIALSLPPEATQIQFQELEPGQTFVLQDGQYFDLRPLYPGMSEHTVIVQYFLPDASRYDFDIPLIYDAPIVTVMVDPGQSVQSAMLDEMGPNDLNGQQVILYQGLDFKGDQSLSFEVRTQRSAGILPFIVAAVVVVVVGGGGVLLRRQLPVAPIRREPIRTTLTEDLIQQVIFLDTEYEAGRINRIDYEAERAGLLYEIAVSRE